MDLQQRHYLARMGKSFANSVRDENLIEARRTARKALNNKAAKYIAEGARGATRRAGLNEGPGNRRWYIDPTRTKPLGGPDPYGRSAGGNFGRPFPSMYAQVNKPNWTSPYGPGGGRPPFNGLPSRPGRGGILPGQGNVPGRPAPGSNMRGFNNNPGRGGLGSAYSPYSGVGRPPRTGGYYYQDPGVRPDPRGSGIPSGRPGSGRPGILPGQGNLAGRPAPGSNMRAMGKRPRFQSGTRPDAPQTGGWPTGGYNYPHRPGGGVNGGFGGSRPTLPDGMNPPPR